MNNEDSLSIDQIDKINKIELPTKKSYQFTLN